MPQQPINFDAELAAINFDEELAAIGEVPPAPPHVRLSETDPAVRKQATIEAAKAWARTVVPIPGAAGPLGGAGTALLARVSPGVRALAGRAGAAINHPALGAAYGAYEGGKHGGVTGAVKGAVLGGALPFGASRMLRRIAGPRPSVAGAARVPDPPAVRTGSGTTIDAALEAELRARATGGGGFTRTVPVPPKPPPKPTAPGPTQTGSASGAPLGPTSPTGTGFRGSYPLPPKPAASSAAPPLEAELLKRASAPNFRTQDVVPIDAIQRDITRGGSIIEAGESGVGLAERLAALLKDPVKNAAEIERLGKALRQRGHIRARLASEPGRK